MEIKHFYVKCKTIFINISMLISYISKSRRYKPSPRPINRPANDNDSLLQELET